MHEDAISLEKLCKERRRLGTILLNLDMYERWGQNSDKTLNQELEKAGEYGATAAEIDEKIAHSINALDDGVLEEWCDAHITLLNDFIERSGEKGASDRNRNSATAIFVASEEKIAWNELKQRKVSRVKQNTFYVKYDEDLFQLLFGFDYSKPG